MDVSKTPDKLRASQQWMHLHHHLLRLGAWVEYVEHAKGVPDMVFTANAGLVKGKDAVLARFRYKERQGEEPYFRKWFEQHGYTVHELSNVAFEGEGDALFAGEVLFMGHGFRSDLAAADQLGKALHVKQVVPLKLVDPRFYHLDTCFCPLSPKLAMLFPGAFVAEELTQIEQHVEVIPVPEIDAAKFVCNAVVLGQDIVLPAGCPDTYALLEARGYRCHPVELSEFIKAGGAAKCLTLKI